MTNTPKAHVRFQEQESRFTGKFRAEIFQTLLGAYKPEMKALLSIVMLGILGRALLLANANVIGIWVDSFCKDPNICKPAPSWTTSWTNDNFIALLMGLSLAGFVLTLIFRISFSRISAHAISRIYDAVTVRVSRFPMSFFDRTPVGRIVTRFSSDYGNIFRMFGGPLAEFIAIIFDLVMMVILITQAHLIFLGLIAIAMTIYYAIYLIHRDVLRLERRELSHSRSPSIAHFAETVQGAASIRTYLRQIPFMKRFEEQNSYFLTQKKITVKNLGLFSLKMNAVTSGLMLAAGVTSYFMVTNNWIGIGAVGVAFNFIAYAAKKIKMFFEWLTQFEEAIIGLERLDQYLRMPLEAGAEMDGQGGTEISTAKPSTRISELKNAAVEFKSVVFRYRSDLPVVLKEISFSIRPGEKFGIVGKTGSGKSSMISALFYLYPIESGEIEVGGYTPILNSSTAQAENQIPLPDYRRAFSYVSQDPTLFRGSLRENLCGGFKISDADLLTALEQVGLGDWLKSLASGLSFQIEERGKNLSQGEKQLICMARCRLQNAPVVIMDEATASVDPQSEELMVKATEKWFEGKTQIIIAHRLSTLVKCDRILWLDSGRIKMLGPAQEVLSHFESADLSGEFL